MIDDLEAEMASWDEINESFHCYYVPNDQDIVNRLTEGDAYKDLGDSDEEVDPDFEEIDSGVSSLEKETPAENTPEVMKISEMELVDKLEQLIDQLQLRSWSTAEDAQSTQAILMRAKKHIYHSKRKQKLLTDFAGPASK